MTKNYFRTHIAIMKPLTSAPNDARRGQNVAPLFRSRLLSRKQ
ncbi:hypothetical protein ACVWWG_009506 [Bradyrhizobium sp. LB7.2]